jgi:hypothetical protein
MSAVMRASAFIEQAGIPVVAVGSAPFEPLGRAVANLMGVPSIPIVSYPGVPLSDTFEEFNSKVVNIVAPAVVDALTTDRLDNRPEPRVPLNLPRGVDGVVFKGSLDDVHDYFIDRNWTDGLPIVPPTRERVNAFLRWTDRSPDEELGVLLPARRAATVWNVAVNGVMSGCAPEYMPILLAAVECIADPSFRLEDAASTTGWEPIVIISGDLSSRLGFNSETGVLRIGRRANSTVGRFLRLYMRNVAGLLPGTTDQGAIAGNFFVALAENDEYIRSELGWPSYREDSGFGPEDTVVAVQSALSSGVPIYSAGDTAEEQMWSITRGFSDAIGLWAGKVMFSGVCFPLLILGPPVAKALKEFGWSKSEIRHYIWENTWVRVADVERSAYGTAGVRSSYGGWAWEPDEATSAKLFRSEPEPMIRTVLDPESIQIVVAGNPGRNQSKAFLQLGHIGAPSTRLVRASSA